MPTALGSRRQLAQEPRPERMVGIGYREEIGAVERRFRVVTQGLSGQIQQAAAGALQECLSGGGIPLTAGCKARVKVSPALGQLAKLQGAAAILSITFTPLPGQPVKAEAQTMVAVAPAGEQHQGSARLKRPDVQRSRGPFCACAPSITARTDPRNPHVTELPEWQVQQTQDGPVVVNQGNVDRKLTGAGEKFPCAVERIYQPVLLPLPALFAHRRAGLLREYRHLGRQRLQPLLQDLVGGQVGAGQG